MASAGSGDEDATSKSGAGKYSDSDLQIEEDQFVIYAPAGKLGLVVDNPDDGAPVVHAIKEDSVLIDQVRVGDRLVGVDEVDVRSLSPVKVSKLISKRSTNPLRKLTLTRAKADLDDDVTDSGLSRDVNGAIRRTSEIDTDTHGESEEFQAHDSDDDTSHVGSMSHLSGEEANESNDFADDMSSQVDDSMSHTDDASSQVDDTSHTGSLDELMKPGAGSSTVGQETGEVAKKADPP